MQGRKKRDPMVRTVVLAALWATLMLAGCSSGEEDPGAWGALAPDDPARDLPIPEGSLCPELEGLPENPDLVFIGDSMLAWNRSQCSQAAGWTGLYTDQALTDLSSTSSLMTNPSSDSPEEDITASYEYARELLPGLETVIVNGGANDLFNDLFVEADSEQVGEDIKHLLGTMLDDGVQKIIYVRYYEFTGIAAFMNRFVDSVMDGPDGVEGFCTRNGIVYIDLRPAFRGHPEFYFEGIHPSRLGSREIAVQLLGHLE
jgi:hypothetical protein